LPEDDPRGDDIDHPRPLDRTDLTGTIQRSPERVHDPSQIPLADRHFEYAPGAPHLIALVKARPISENDGANVVLFKVQRQSGDRRASIRRTDLQHLARHGVHQTIDTGDPVLDLKDFSHLVGVQILLIVLDRVEENALDFARSEP